MTPAPARQLASESNAQDVELMLRVQSRDPQAMRALYDRHSTMVYGLGLRILRQASDAEDLTQDVFLHLWRRAELFDGRRGSFLGWLVSLTRNRAVDRIRSRRAYARTADAYEVERQSDVSPRQHDPNESAHVVELRKAIARALTVLPEVQRTALELAYFGGLSHSEIAERLETPLGTVKARIRQGMFRLRDLLGDFVDTGVTSQADQTWQEPRPWQAPQGAQVQRAEQVEQAEEAAQTEQTEQTEQVEQVEQAEQAEQAEDDRT